jgi:hypothetical protein
VRPPPQARPERASGEGDGVLLLAAFVLARIADDEATARAAVRTTEAGDVPGWYWSNAGDAVFLDETDVPVACGPWKQAMHQPTAQHIVRWDPARVMAECEAKRRAVQTLASRLDDEPEEHLLRLLAMPYADHPAYRPEWRP